MGKTKQMEFIDRTEALCGNCGRPRYSRIHGQPLPGPYVNKYHPYTANGALESDPYLASRFLAVI